MEALPQTDLVQALGLNPLLYAHGSASQAIQLLNGLRLLHSSTQEPALAAPPVQVSTPLPGLPYSCAHSGADAGKQLLHIVARHSAPSGVPLPTGVQSDCSPPPPSIA